MSNYSKQKTLLEARVGIEPTNKGFADLRTIAGSALLATQNLLTAVFRPVLVRVGLAKPAAAPPDQDRYLAELLKAGAVVSAQGDVRWPFYTGPHSTTLMVVEDWMDSRRKAARVLMAAVEFRNGPGGELELIEAVDDLYGAPVEEAGE